MRMALEKAADAGLRVWTITGDGSSVNISTFQQLGCSFGTTFESMTTKFKHPSQNYYVYVILDPCHMLKLARNALGSLSLFKDNHGGGDKVAVFPKPSYYSATTRFEDEQQTDNTTPAI